MPVYSAEKVRTAVNRMSSIIDSPFDESVVDELMNILEQTAPERQDEEIEQYLFKFYFGGSPAHMTSQHQYIPHNLVCITTQAMLFSYFACDVVPKGTMPLAGSVVTRWMAMVNFMINKWEEAKSPDWQQRCRELRNQRTEFVAFCRYFDGEHIPYSILPIFKNISRTLTHCKDLRVFINEGNDANVQDPVEEINFFVDYFKEQDNTDQ